jgi:hypothetical protein
MSIENSSATVGPDLDFRTTFALLPQVLKISKAIQAKQNEPQKQQALIQAAVR